MSDATRIKELLRDRVGELAPYLYPNGKRDGNNWCVGDITGTPGRSFKICIAGEKAGLWGDFADSEKHSSNLLNLWMQARNVDFKAALREAAEWTGYSLHSPNGARTLPAKAAPETKPTFPTLLDAIAHTKRKLKKRFTRQDWYHDCEGNKHFVVVRFDDENEKVFRPFHKNALSRWVPKDPPGNLPLFRLLELLARPNEPVLVVEGEKCACELEKLGFLVTTSSHGAKSSHKTDWQALAGRKVVIWPDNDENGRRYAKNVLGILTQLSPPTEVRMLGVPGLPEKGDCVDWLEKRSARMPEEITAELSALIEKARQITPFTDRNQDDHHGSEGHDEQPGRKSAATQLLDFASEFSFFHDPQDRPFVRLDVNGHTEVWPAESSKFRKLLAGLYYKRVHKAINRNALTDAITTLAARACHDSPEEPVFLRVAPDGENILIDLGDTQWRVIEVASNGWRMIPKSPIAFVRTGSMQALPEPVRGGSIELLWKLLNVTKEQRPLVAGALLNAFHPHGPYFVTNYVGEQGTAKSCAARIHRQLVDPNENPLRSPPKEERDLLAQAASNRCVALDNLSSLPPWLSDALCRLATGGGHSARTLYTDLEEISLAVKRPVILNGIEDVATRPDLAERVLQIELETIPDHKRISEKDLWREFDRQRAVIFSAILDALVCALRELAKVSLDSLPRMADAALWATAGEPAFGWKRGTFITAYRQNLNEGAIASVEAHPVGVTIRQLLEEQSKWQGEPAQLLEVLNRLASEEQRQAKSWPKDARSLGHCLRRLAQVLRRVGIAIERDKGTRRIIRLCKAREKTSETSASPENHAPKDVQDVADDLSPHVHK